MKRVLGILLVLSVLAGACLEDQQPTYDNPFDPNNGQGLPVPDSLVVYVGNNAVRLYWGLPEGATADEFAVFRQRLDVTEDEDLLGRVRERTFLDNGVRNGRVYAYRIAAAQSGVFGPRSEAIEARPGVYSIAINADAPKTRSRTVTIGLTAPEAETVRLYEDPAAEETTPSLPAAPTISKMLSPGDGDKTVYCVMRLADGSESIPVFDTIVLDTRATIQPVEFGDCVDHQPGQTVHWRLVADEPLGTASVDVAGYITGLTLYDDGTNGDRTADDGTYERDYVLPSGRSVVNASVTGQFTDDIGNTASPLLSQCTFTVREVPAPVQLVRPPILGVPPSSASVTLRWTQAAATDFAAYQVFRSETAPVDSTSRQVGTVNSKSTLQFVDTDVIERRAYFYRVYLLTTSGAQSGSDTVHVAVPNERPPLAVTLDPAESIASTQLSLHWSRAADLDFAAYLVYRSETATVTEDDTLVARLVGNPDHNYWDDLQLVENTTYHYRVFVEDTGGKTSPRSNEISATTIDEPPADVTLFAATDVTSIAATLSWEASTDSQFAFYRLFRATGRPVTTDSTLVVEIELRDTTSYRDTGIDPGTTYYYRLFVVGEDDSVSEGSNTIQVDTPN